MDKGFLFLSLTLIFISLGLVIFEWKEISSKKLVVIAVLAALAALGRVPFAVIPSAQPTTFLVIISGYVLGPLAGFLVGIVAAVVSNIFLGQGPWTIMQMLAWGLCGLSAGVLGKIAPNINRPILVVFGFAWGFLFGWIMNLWHWLSFVYPLNFQSWFLTNVTSFGFDLIHALSNALFMFMLGGEFIKILNRFKQKLSYEHHGNKCPDVF